MRFISSYNSCFFDYLNMKNVSVNACCIVVKGRILTKINKLGIYNKC